MLSRLPEVSRCCGCASLRTGSLIFGYMSGVFSMIGLGIYIGLIVSVSSGGAQPSEGEAAAAASPATYVSLGFQCFGYVNNLMLSIVLVIGTHKGIPLMLRMSWHGLLINVIFNAIVACVVAVLNNFYINLGQLVWWVIGFYLVLVVRSLHLETLRHKFEVTSQT